MRRAIVERQAAGGGGHLGGACGERSGTPLSSSEGEEEVGAGDVSEAASDQVRGMGLAGGGEAGDGVCERTDRSVSAESSCVEAQATSGSGDEESGSGGEDSAPSLVDAEEDTVCDTESSAGSDSSREDEGGEGWEHWAQVVGEEERQETSGGKRKWWLFDTVNPNAWGASEGRGGGLNFLRRTAADVVGMQETRIMGEDRCNAGMQAARHSKWKAKLTEARTTEKGYASAGVTVACRAHFGISHPQALGWCYDSTRIQHAHVGAVCRGGIHCISVYLHTCEGMSEKNRGLLMDLARIVRHIRGPWIIMGDWNMAPEVLQASGWVDEICGKAVCPGVPTCKKSIIDYFVVDRRLMHAVLYVKRMEGFGSRPHYPVRMALRALPRSLRVRRMIAPQKIPAVLPQGCLPEHACAEEGFIGEASGGGSGRDLSERVGVWLDGVESVLSDVLGKEGKMAERVCGRARGPRMVWKCALGSPGDAAAFSTKISRSWAKLRGWCMTIRQAKDQLGDALRNGHPLGKAAEVCSRRIKAAGKWAWRESEEKEVLSRFIGAFERTDIMNDGGALRGLEQWAEQEAERTARVAASDSARRYSQWLQEGPARGLARQHAASKCKGHWVPGRMVQVRDNIEDGIAQAVNHWAVDDGAEGGTVDGGVEGIMRNIHRRELGDVEVPADVQQEVEWEGDRWARIWTQVEGTEECVWPEVEAGSLPEINAQRVLEATDTFAEGVGLGWDQLHPRALKRVPVRMLDELGRILMQAEKEGTWGSSMGLVVTALIPKNGGGLRPIGLLPTLVRLWARIRAREVQGWEADNDREYLYGGCGKGAMSAAWKFAARAEAARLQGAEYAAVLLDLEKAFDRVPHHRVIEAAREWGYPLAILRLSLEAYRLGRVVGVGGVFSGTIMPLRGLAAGSVHATRELRALMISIFDRVARIAPSVTLSVYVDDSTLECSGTQRTVVEALSVATTGACTGLEAAGMSLSATKNIVLASRKGIGIAVQARLGQWGVRWCGFGKMLGIGAVAGIRRTTKGLAERAAAFARRGGLFAGLRRVRVDVARVLRTGGTAAAQFGQATMGMADYSLLQLRRRVAGLVGGEASGKDPNLVLIAADARIRHMVDPAFSAHSDVVVHWATAIWENWIPLASMQKAFLKARAELAVAKRHWSVVRGPAAAMTATLARIGWVLVDATTAYTDRLEQVSFLKDPPAMVKMMVNASVRRWRWRIAGMGCRAGDGGAEGPVWSPIAELIATGRWCNPLTRRTEVQLQSGESAALQSAFVGGQWPQCRLHAAGLSESVECELCRCVGVPSVGNLKHRIYECPHVAGRSAKGRPQRVTEEWARRGRGGTGAAAGGCMLEWERGIVLEPCIDRRARAETVEWVVEPDGFVVGATVFIDGSQYDSLDERFLALGWSYAIFQNERLVGLARGIPPPFVRSIPAAEAWALAMAVGAVDVASSQFYTDCMAVRTLARGGQRKATSGRQVNARTWATVFNRTDGEKPMVEWIPAHRGEAQIGVAKIGDGSLLSRAQWEGNRLVDRHAKIAAAGGRRVGEVARYVASMQWVAVLAGWIGRATFAANHGAEEPYRDSTAEKAVRWAIDAGGEGAGGTRSRVGQQEKKLLRPLHLGGHSLKWGGAGWSCSICNKASWAWNTLAGRLCGGSAAGLWARRARVLGGHGGSDGAGHVRAHRGGVVWCVKCGAYAVRWAVGLAEPCREGPTNPSQRRVLARLRAGRHPRTNQQLEGEVVVEVLGLEAGVGTVVERRVEGAGLAGKRGKNFVGYARRPGGMRLIDDDEAFPVASEGVRDEEGGAEHAEGAEIVGGTRRAFFERRKRIRLGTAVGEGEEWEARRREAAKAADEEERVAADMVNKWRRVLARQEAVGERGDEGGVHGLRGGEQESAESRGGTAGGVAAVGEAGRGSSMGGVAAGWVGVTRKQLVGALVAAVQARVANKEAGELGHTDEGDGVHGGRSGGVDGIDPCRS